MENNLTDFKAYLDDPDSEIRQYLGENGIIYTYDVKSLSVYSYDEEGQADRQRYRRPKASSPFMMGGSGQSVDYSSYSALFRRRFFRERRQLF